MHSDQDLPHSEISLHHQLLLDVCCPLAAHPSPLPDIFHSIPGSSPASDLRVQCCSIYGPSSPSSTLCIYQLQRPSLSPPSEAFAPFVGSMSQSDSSSLFVALESDLPPPAYSPQGSSQMYPTRWKSETSAMWTLTVSCTSTLSHPLVPFLPSPCHHLHWTPAVA